MKGLRIIEWTEDVQISTDKTLPPLKFKNKLDHKRWSCLTSGQLYKDLVKLRPKQGWYPLDICTVYSTASTTIHPYQSSDYVTFTSNSDISQRAPSNGGPEELAHRNSLPDTPSENVVQERRRVSQGRSNGLQTQQIRNSKQEKVSKLNSVESGSPVGETPHEHQTLNDRVQIPTQDKFKQNYFKPLGARSGHNLPVSNNHPVILHHRNGNNSGPRDDENIVAMGTLVGSSNTGTTPALKSSRSSSGSNSGQGPNTASNSHFNQGNQGVNLGLRKFNNNRYNQGKDSPYYSQNNANNHTKLKDDEPRYPDPVTGAPAAFQQRIAELASLEADTVRHERAKRLKKRCRDS